MRRRIALALVVIVAASAGWFTYAKVAKSRREAAYATAMDQYRRDLRIGMTSDQVVQYLHSRNVPYSVVQIGGREGPTYLVKIGEEPGSLVCEPWNVYVAIEFGSAETLSDVHVSQVGTCL